MVLFCLPCPSFCMNKADGNSDDRSEATNSNNERQRRHGEEESRNLGLLEMLFLPCKKKNLFVDLTALNDDDDGNSGCSGRNEFTKDVEKEDNLSRTTHSTFDSQFDDLTISSNENTIKSLDEKKTLVAVQRMRRSRLRPSMAMPIPVSTSPKPTKPRNQSLNNRSQSQNQSRSPTMMTSAQEITAEDLALMLTPTPFTIFLQQQDEMSIQSSLLSLGVDFNVDLDLDLDLDGGDRNGNSSYCIDIDGDKTKWTSFENFFDVDVENKDKDSGGSEDSNSNNDHEEEDEISVVTCSTFSSLGIKLKFNAKNGNTNGNGNNDGLNHHQNILVLVNQDDEDDEFEDDENENQDDDGDDDDDDYECLDNRSLEKQQKRTPIEPEGELYEPGRKDNARFQFRTCNNNNNDNDYDNDTDNDGNGYQKENVSSPRSKSLNKISLRNNRVPFHPSFYYKLNLNDSSEADENKKVKDNNAIKRIDPKMKRRRFRFFFFFRRRKQRSNSLPATAFTSSEVRRNDLHLDSTALQKLNALYNSEPILGNGRCGSLLATGESGPGTVSFMKQNTCTTSATSNSATNIRSIANERSMMKKKRKHQSSSISSESESYFSQSTHTASSFVPSHHAQSDDVVSNRENTVCYREEEVFDSLTASFMQNTGRPTISMVLTQFKGRLSKRSKIVNRVLHSSHDNGMMMDCLKFSILDEDEKMNARKRGEGGGGGDNTSISSLCAETDVQIVTDPFARPSKRMKKACNHLSGDGDVWVEKVMRNKKTGKRRSFFYSIRTGERKTDEPPSGASTVIFSLTDPHHGRSSSNRCPLKPHEEIQGDDDLWVEKVQIDEKTEKERSFFYSVKTGFCHVDEPPTGASKIIYKTDGDIEGGGKIS